jgi:hypothetical protein
MVNHVGGKIKMTSIQSMWFIPRRERIMAKPSRKSRKPRNIDVKSAAANDNTELAANQEVIAAPVELPKREPVTAEQIATGTVVSARTAAIRRSQAGKFNKAVLSVIGGKEAPKFYPWTWEQRDKFMAGDTVEAKVVKARYQAHMASVKP